MCLPCGQPERAWRLPDREASIGRSSEADLILPNVSVSRFHANLIREGDEWTIEDLQSQNGVQVNGLEIQKQVLRSDDRILLGKFELVFIGNERLGFYQGKEITELPQFSPYASGSGEDTTFQFNASQLQQMREAMRLEAEAQVVNVNDVAQCWTPGESPLKFGGPEGPHVEGFLARGVVAEIRWNGTSHVLVRRSSWTKVCINDKSVTEQQLRPNDRLRIGKSEFRYGYPE